MSIPVRLDGNEVVAKGKLLSFITEVPGIAPADAFDVGDQMGTVIVIEGVPPAGTIVEMKFHDLDDEGLDKEVWVFSANPTLAVSDAAFSIADVDNLSVLGVFAFTTWRDAVNNQVGMTANTPCSYRSPNGKLYLAVKTLGVDNIAQGSMPQISLVIEAEEG